MLDRQAIKNAWSGYFNGYDKGYWITLNSRWKVSSIADPRVRNQFLNLEPHVQKFVHKLNKHCYGRSYMREEKSKLKVLAAYEVGKVDGLIHCHIIAAHDGSTDRTTDEINLFSKLKWNQIHGAWGRDQFVDVDAVDDVNDRLWYVAKQTQQLQRLIGESNIAIY